MDYDIDISCAYTSLIADAIKAYFDFDDATRFVKSVYYSAVEWDAIIYNELAERRPVAYFCSHAESQSYTEASLDIQKP